MGYPSHVNEHAGVRQLPSNLNYHQYLTVTTSQTQALRLLVSAINLLVVPFR